LGNKNLINLKSKIFTSKFAIFFFAFLLSFLIVYSTGDRNPYPEGSDAYFYVTYVAQHYIKIFKNPFHFFGGLFFWWIFKR